ncbi:hypothetical protein [Xanthomonas oryzae]|nr:hypothetical protein [Xanthomonas oryzae]MEC5080754.1 hypothetical protein [Xanthomonas oryzae pv. oryzicola]MEC5115673.1 hypothetical protein [Xanthomonas oryzae pv. oryzicola]UBB93365.1 hypothetical protein K2I41_01625 [Xanthomonas oryzae pv. oryzicola]WGY41333.1 hypothetical protein HED68_01325 [Xanthomonas oryzae pv. oryzicola]
MANIEDFHEIFPDAGQDVEFISDFVSRVGESRATNILNRIWEGLVDKKLVQGIHGTLFFELDKKKVYYPTKKESEMSLGI